MWLMTTFGFFSIVRKKPTDTVLTIRAPVKSDLEALRKRCLPALSDIEEDPETDCKFYANATREEVASALARIAMEIDYASFKDRTKEMRGSSAARIYSGLWEVLWELKGSENPV